MFSVQMQVEALARLHALCPLCPEAFLAEGGQHVMLQLLGLDPAANAPVVGATLRNLSHLVQHAPEMAEVLGEGGGLRPVLQLLRVPGTAQSTRRLCLLLLASLCRVNVDNFRRLRHEQGVQALLSVLSDCKAVDPTLPSTYVVAALDAVWACVAADRKNTARFLVEDGMDILLDLLEVSHTFGGLL
jgi:hypothetical protein